MRILVVADESERDGGYVAERLVQRGAVIDYLDRDALPHFAELDAPAMFLLLGSDKSAHEARWRDSVAAESALVRAALREGIPVMAICYGAQLVARALGGTSYRADDPEVGWRRVDTVDEVLCPEGPWGQFHQDALTPPQDAEVLGSSWYGPQCFIDDSLGGRVIAWQFHPEVTVETFSRWVDEASDMVRAARADPGELTRQALAHAASTRNRAHDLVDAALDHLGVHAPQPA